MDRQFAQAFAALKKARNEYDAAVDSNITATAMVEEFNAIFKRLFKKANIGKRQKVRQRMGTETKPAPPKAAPKNKKQNTSGVVHRHAITKPEDKTKEITKYKESAEKENTGQDNE